ncbi:MAG: Bax inhibitor-1/YccA family protein [Paraprevotella sp.]|nr:Bax inhibitor-1/YccA family protein [Paraprevotella sp.]
METRNVYAYHPEERTQVSVFSKLMRSVYRWMTLALVITGLTAAYVANNPTIMELIWGHQGVYLGLIVAELVVVFVLIGRENKLSFTNATLLFILYSLLTGATLSVIFLVYELGSIATTFFITAGTFGAMSVVGYFTKKDLSKMGTYLIMALIGMIIATVVNWFVASSTLDWIITYVLVLVFVGLTAYDTQKIKLLLQQEGLEVNENTQKMALMGSLTLYLDFINLFLQLLKIFGRKR